MDKGTIAMLVTAFVTLILGISLLTVIATEEQEKVNLVAVINESIDISGARLVNNDLNESHTFDLTYYNTASGWKTADDDCDIDVTSLYIDDATAGTEDTDWSVTTDGVVTILNTTTTVGVEENTSLATYSYCPDHYLSEGWTRSVLNLVPGFFAISLLMISLALFYAIMKKEGILDI